MNTGILTVNFRGSRKQKITPVILDAPASVVGGGKAPPVGATKWRTTPMFVGTKSEYRLSGAIAADGGCSVFRESLRQHDQAGWVGGFAAYASSAAIKDGGRAPQGAKDGC